MSETKKPPEKEQGTNEYQAALLRVAQHVGVVGHQMPPDRLAVAICSSIDTLVGKPLSEASEPGSERRSITANVRKIKLSGAVDVVVIQGGEPKLEVFANDANDLSKVITSVSGDCLIVDNVPITIVVGKRISMVHGGMTIVMNSDDMEPRYESQGFRVEVTLPSVTTLKVSGAGRVIYRNIQQEELSLDVSGAGAIDLTGKVNRLDAEVSGSGYIDAYTLFASHGHLRVSGVGNIKSTVAKSVVARVSGMGKIKIAGNPVQRDTNVSGMGKIKFVDGNS